MPNQITLKVIGETNYALDVGKSAFWEYQEKNDQQSRRKESILPDAENKWLETGQEVALDLPTCAIVDVVQLSIRADRGLRFAAPWECVAEDGYIKIVVKPKDVVELVDFSALPDKNTILPFVTIKNKFHFRIGEEFIGYSYKDRRTGEPCFEVFLYMIEKGQRLNCLLPPESLHQELCLVIGMLAFGKKHKRTVKTVKIAADDNQLGFDLHSSLPIKNSGDYIVLAPPDEEDQYYDNPDTKFADDFLLVLYIANCQERDQVPPDLLSQIGARCEVRKTADEVRASMPRMGFPWRDLYCPLHIPDAYQDLLPLKDLLCQPYRVQMYFRACNRWPGGNAEMMTIRYEFDLLSDQHTHNSVQTHVYSHDDWDMKLEGPFQPKSICLEGLHSAIRSRVLRLTEMDSMFTIVDNTSKDSEEYDTEWSSVEILVFTKGWCPHLRDEFPQAFDDRVRELQRVNHRMEESSSKLNKDCLQPIIKEIAASEEFEPVLICRLHQECVMGPQFSHGPDNDLYRADPTPEQTDMVEFLSNSIGMGRPKSWHGHRYAEPECQAGKDYRTARDSSVIPSSNHSIGVCAQPLMFRL